MKELDDVKTAVQLELCAHHYCTTHACDSSEIIGFHLGLHFVLDLIRQAQTEECIAQK